MGRAENCMPHAVFHIIFAILIAELIREYFVKDKRKFPIHYVFIAGIAGALPDLDIAAFWILNFFGYSIEEVHRTFTHTLLVPLVFLFLGLITWNFKNKEFGKRHMKLHTIFFMASLGVITHLLFDATISGSVMPFYPLNKISFGINVMQFLPLELQNLLLPCMDAGIFIMWLFWLEYKHKISSFI